MSIYITLWQWVQHTHTPLCVNKKAISIRKLTYLLFRSWNLLTPIAYSALVASRMLVWPKLQFEWHEGLLIILAQVQAGSTLGIFFFYILTAHKWVKAPLIQMKYQQRWKIRSVYYVKPCGSWLLQSGLELVVGLVIFFPLKYECGGVTPRVFNKNKINLSGLKHYCLYFVWLVDGCEWTKLKAICCSTQILFCGSPHWVPSGFYDCLQRSSASDKCLYN